MGDQINASSKAIIDLYNDIKTCILKINTLNEDLSAQLKALGNTFQDDGYSVIQCYVSSSQKKVDEALPDLRVVMMNLVEYARLLKESENRIN